MKHIPPDLSWRDEAESKLWRSQMGSVSLKRSILHYGELKTIALVSGYVDVLLKKFYSFLTTAAFLLVLLLMRRFCSPKEVGH